MLNVVASTSTNTGVAPTRTATSAVAERLEDVYKRTTP